ncbi:MAG: EF-hand domain-containing protein [Pseudorhizobium pelagicum]|uniref:EF-hand domain-containing protein n=1 Tax=Pseudorhizobium pelagicum TaxID=1509405 RepID=UPI0034600E9F
MKVTSDHAVISLIASMSRKDAISDFEPPTENLKRQSRLPLNSPQGEDLVDVFHARLAKQQLDWADTNKDGAITEMEYLDGQARLAALNGQPYDPTVSEGIWAKLDTEGKGWISSDELSEGLKKLLPVRAGHLDPGYADRLRNPTPDMGLRPDGLW